MLLVLKVYAQYNNLIMHKRLNDITENDVLFLEKDFEFKFSKKCVSFEKTKLNSNDVTYLEYKTNLKI